MGRLKKFLNWPELKREPPPRIAIAIVAVGLLACVVAAVATAGKGSGEAAHLSWVQERPVEDSKPVKVPGGEQTMQLTQGRIRATGTNDSGRSLFQVAEVLKIGAEAPVGKARALCSIHAPSPAEIGQSSGGLRALYPRSSEGGIYNQEVPETVILEFSSHGYEFAVLEVGDLSARFTNERGVKVEWPEFEAGTEHIKYFIEGKPKKTLELPFNSIWRSTGIAEASVSCTLETSAGKATVTTKAALKKLTPPINEEAEEEEREAQEAEEGETDEAGGEGE